MAKVATSSVCLTKPFLHEFGEFEVKHGVRLNLVNLYSDELGNPARPTKLEVKTVPASISASRFGSPRLLLAVAGLFPISLGAAAWWFATRPIEPAFLPSAAQSAPVVPEKSVAVLPFENLSSALSKIADLKVISQISTRPYKERAGKPLQVSFLSSHVQHDPETRLAAYHSLVGLSHL